MCARWPAGRWARPTPCAVEMTNLLGFEADGWQALAAEPDARVWLYGKREARAGPQDGPCEPAEAA